MRCRFTDVPGLLCRCLPLTHSMPWLHVVRMSSSSQRRWHLAPSLVDMSGDLTCHDVQPCRLPSTAVMRRWCWESASSLALPPVWTPMCVFRTLLPGHKRLPGIDFFSARPYAQGGPESRRAARTPVLALKWLCGMCGAGEPHGCGDAAVLPERPHGPRLWPPLRFLNCFWAARLGYCSPAAFRWLLRARSVSAVQSESVSCGSIAGGLAQCGSI